MKIIMIYDQIQAGAGTKDDKMVPMQGKKTAMGPAVMMEPFLKNVDGHVIACLYCGTGTFQEDPETNSKKFCAMAKKMGADIVICGPCYNYKDYSAMAAKIAYEMNQKTDIPAICAMSEEMSDVIDQYKTEVAIVKMPKKGGTGLNDALRNILDMAKTIVDKGNVEAARQKYCY